MGKTWKECITWGYLLLILRHAMWGNAWNIGTSTEDTKPKSYFCQNPKKIKSLERNWARFDASNSLFERSFWIFVCSIYKKYTSFPLYFVRESLSHSLTDKHTNGSLIFGKMIVKISVKLSYVFYFLLGTWHRNHWYESVCSESLIFVYINWLLTIKLILYLCLY